MKKLRLSMLLIMTGYICFSQALKPTLLTKEGDTLFAFSTEQSKRIAVMLSNGMYCDSIHGINDRILAIQDSIIKSQKSLISTIQLINANNNGQITGLNILNSTIKTDLNESQDLNARLKKHRWVYFGAGVLTSATAVYLMK